VPGVTLRRIFRCWLLRKHRWVRRRARGDEEYWECRDCGEMFTGAMPTGEGKYRAPFGM